jgi:hypothetical protein
MALLSYLLRTYMHYYHLCVCTYIMRSGMHGTALDHGLSCHASLSVGAGQKGGVRRAARDACILGDACRRALGLLGLLPAGTEGQ